MKDLRSAYLAELEEYMDSIQEAKFRAVQVFEWLHKKKITSYEEMRNISIRLREKLKEDFLFNRLEELFFQESSIDKTRKYLFKLGDGNTIESVLMPYKHGNTVCISTQVGCRMGCRFCASTIGGLVRNLSAGEMLAQVYDIEKSLGERISNVVLMGTGEPLDNYEQVLRFIRIISNPRGMQLSQRNITVSTCGIVPNIRRLAEEKLQITLAISLHASEDTTRKCIMPVANQYSMEEVLEACRYYFHKTKRRISIEYSLVSGVNDSLEEARRLAGKIRHMHMHVNLIPVNPIQEREYRSSALHNINQFRSVLEKEGINVTIRREMGRDIEGACGQLRRRYETEK